MRKSILCAALALAPLLAAPAVAQELLPIDERAAAPHYTFTESDGILSTFTLDIPLPQVHERLSFESEYTRHTASPDHDGSADSARMRYGGYGVYALPLGRDVALRARAGLALERTELADETVDADLAGSLSLGLSLRLHKDLRLVADHTLAGPDDGAFRIGLQKRF